MAIEMDHLRVTQACHIVLDLVSLIRDDVAIHPNISPGIFHSRRHFYTRRVPAI